MNDALYDYALAKVGGDVTSTRLCIAYHTARLLVQKYGWRLVPGEDA